MKFKMDEFEQIVEKTKSNDTYDIYDLKTEHLVLSMTVLHPGKETRGHDHAEVDEIYFCISGSGEIQLGEEKQSFKAGDIVTISPGLFHKVFNTSDLEDLKLVCVFEKYERK